MDRLSIGQTALDRTLQLAAQDSPQAAARAAIALRHLLQGIIDSAWSEVAWQFSPLTGDGFPVEFAFTTADAAIRYTTEIAGPETAPSVRLPLAQQLLAQLGVLPLPTELCDRVARLQATGPLQYGAWVSGRHNATSDRYKLYLEMPTELTAKTLNQIAPDWAGSSCLPHRSVSLRMIGYDLSAARIERYYHVEGLAFWEIDRLLYQLGLSNPAAVWQNLFCQMSHLSLSSALPGNHIGFSLSLSDQGVPTVSLFTFARSVFGCDLRARQQLLRLAAQHGWNLSLYERLSEPLIAQTGADTAHGMVTVVIAPIPVLGIGLRPPQALAQSLNLLS